MTDKDKETQDLITEALSASTLGEGCRLVPSTPKAFPLTFDFAEGDSFTNELLKGRKVENVQDLRTLLTMLEGDAPMAGHGYRKVYFHSQGLMIKFRLNSDCGEARSHIINVIDEMAGLA